MTASPPLRVFLAHAKEDKPLVLEIYHLLELDGFAPWVDKENLIPGHHWELEIERAVKSSHVVIAFYSSSGMGRSSYSHKEIKLAIEVAEQQPEGAIFIIPIGLDGCEVPERLSHLHCGTMPREMVAEIYTLLRRSLLARAAHLGFITREQLQEMPADPAVDKAFLSGKRSSLRPGRYLVRGENPGGGKYYGTATVGKSDDGYSIVWNIRGRQINGYGKAPCGDLKELRISVEGEADVIFSCETWSGVYEATWGSGGIEQLIPASPFLS